MYILFFIFCFIIDAKKINYEKTPAKLLDNKTSCEEIKKNKDFKKYCENLKGIKKNIFLKLYKMKKIKKGNNYNPYLYLYKDNQQFYVETFAYLDIKFKDAYPYIVDYKSYGDWILQNFNTSKSGLKDMNFLKLDKMTYDEKKNLLTISTKLNFVFKKKYDLYLKMIENYDAKYAKTMKLKILKPTSLTPDINGTFIYYEIPNSDYMIIYFYGYAKLHWALYNMLPLSFMKVYVSEKAEIIYENISYKIEEIKEKIKENKRLEKLKKAKSKK